jgi:hypothetical protein
MADVQEILKKKFGGAAPARTGMLNDCDTGALGAGR